MQIAAVMDTSSASNPSSPDCRISDGHLSQKSRLNPVDFRALEYVGSYDHNLMCAICHSPFVSPVKLSCEHVFCQHCVNQAMRHQPQDLWSCPSCRRKIDAASVTPVPKILHRILEELVVKCPLRKKGCLESMPRCRVQDHVLKYCCYFEVECPDEHCSLSLQRKDVDGARCLHDQIKCCDCKQSIMMRDMKAHRILECEIARTACPHCKDQVLSRHLETHIESCPDAIFPCTAADYGCDFIAKRADLDQHIKHCALAKLTPFLKKQNDRLKAHETALNHLRHKNSVLETSFSTIQETLGPSMNLIDDSSTSEPASDPGPFDSTAHHLLCLHESLREEVTRVSAAVSEIDAKASMVVMNESLRVKEDFAHTNAAIGGIRMQLHWLMSARLQNQQRLALMRTQPSGEDLQIGPSSTVANTGTRSTLPVRRSSDSSRQETKL